GTLTARSIGKVRVKGGSISGDIITTAGDIDRIQISGGNLNANVTSAGRINLLNLVGGSAIGGHRIQADHGIGKVMIKGGNLDADLISGGGIDRIRVNGGNITGMVSAALGIRQVKTTGAIANTTIRAGGSIAKLDAANLNNAIISSGWDIGKVKINGSMVASKILAGYDVGDDGQIGGGDDNPLNGGVVHSGTISKLDIRGALNGSVVMAGIDPTDNSEADGVSSISRMTVRGGYLNTGSSEVRADTYIDSKFAAEAAAAGVTVSSAVTYIPDTTGTVPFGPDTAIGKTLVVGELSLTLTSGTGYYRASTGELILVGTGSRSSLMLRNDGAPLTISIESADDSGVGNLRVIGNITLGDMDVDGHVKSLQAYSVAPGSTWNLPGGVRSAKLGALTNVDVSAGYVRDWKMSGAYSSGTFTADGMRQFRVDSTMGADLIISLGGAHKIQVRGNQTGDIESRDTVKTLDVRGALSGDVTVTHGDLTMVKTGGALSGAVDVTRGYTKQVKISSGDFGGSADTSFRTARGIRKFDVRAGNLTGLVSTGGDLRDLKVARGWISGRVWSDGSMRNVRAYGIDEGMVAASGDILKVKIAGDMFGGWILAGFDPGDAGYDPAHGGEAANLVIDAFTWSPWRTGENADQASAGTIKQVDIGGDMGRTYDPFWGMYLYSGSTIAAGIEPGIDGYLGTPDDLVAATGYVFKVKVKGGIFGSGWADESYGVFAANNMPVVFRYSKQPFQFNGNAHVDTLLHPAGPPVVMDVFVSYDLISVQFDHPVNMGTIDEYSFTILGSTDMVFDPLVDTNVSTTVANTISYDASRYMVTFRLDSGTWQSIGVGSYFQVTLDGSVITDIRGLLLDGEMSALFPSGDHIPGGDFVYEFAYGQYDLSADVPAYTWWHGCSPTAAGMLAGYYDGLGYDDLIVGDASTQTDDVNEAIASSGDGVYTGGGGVISSGTVGTGHIPDYALYNDIDDSSEPWPEPDMSEDWIVAYEGVLPHPDDCLADFMGTSQSALGSGMGWTGSL
ncbi:MAG: hypothetical protein KAX78_03170, partial [Phycisphaerae bacterium]|nr:hypothetical protein [Phycisphaerae bacterium]